MMEYAAKKYSIKPFKLLELTPKKIMLIHNNLHARYSTAYLDITLKRNLPASPTSGAITSSDCSYGCSSATSTSLKRKYKKS